MKRPPAHMLQIPNLLSSEEKELIFLMHYIQVSWFMENKGLSLVWGRIIKSLSLSTHTTICLMKIGPSRFEDRICLVAAGRTWLLMLCYVLCLLMM
jgi:hypothetical protein